MNLRKLFRGGRSTAEGRPEPGIPNDAIGKRLMLIGHSHLGALSAAWSAREKAGSTEGLNVSIIRLGRKNSGPEIEGRMPERRVTRNLRQRMAHVLRRDRPDAIVAVLMGNEYNSLAMVRHAQPFDLLPRTEGVDPDLAGIPESLMAEHLANLARQNGILIWKSLAEQATCPIFLLPPPPPIASQEHILAHPGTFAELAARHGVNPAPLRLRMWQIYCNVLARAVADNPGTTFVNLPDRILEGRYLAPAHWQGDPTHANGVYGEIVLDHLMQNQLAGLS